MKLSYALVCLVVVAPATVAGQTTSAPQTVTAEALPPSPEYLEQLLGPIALYPDALIALILPAAAAPADIVLAARQLREAPGDRSQIEHRAWDDSVKALTSYPEVLQWLDENLSWTKHVGELFVLHPAAVMQTIQRLRARATSAGTLIDTPQQQVIREAEIIRIVPAQPHVIYVPRYEPDVVFLPQPRHAWPLITFGVGVGIGSWLAYDCDWRRHTIWVGSRHRAWTPHDWRRPLYPSVPQAHAYAPPPGVRAWRPPTHAVHPSRQPTFYRPSQIQRPTAVGTTVRPPLHSRSGSSSMGPQPAQRPAAPRPANSPVAPSFSEQRPNRTLHAPAAATPLPVPQTQTVYAPSAANARPAPVYRHPALNSRSPARPDVGPVRDHSRSAPVMGPIQRGGPSTAAVPTLNLPGSPAGSAAATITPGTRDSGQPSPTPERGGNSRGSGARSGSWNRGVDSVAR